MRAGRLILIICFYLADCETDRPLPPDNPTYSGETEDHIQQVISHLQVETVVDGVYKSKTLAEQMKYYHTPGVSIAVIQDNRLEWARGFGVRNDKSDPVDIHTLFEAGSVSKPVFALAVMRLKEQGKLDLDRDVNEYLHSWKIPPREGWTPVVTFRELLSHTAGMSVHGFPGYLKSDSIPGLPQVLDGVPPANTNEVRANIIPGTAFRYSGGGVTIAQLAVMDIVNKPFPVIMNEELINPLGLKYSTYNQPLPDSLENLASTAYPYSGVPVVGRYDVYPEMAAAGLWSNPTELATILIEVRKALNGESHIFKKETIEEMLTPQIIAPMIGIGFFLDNPGDSVRFSHSGWDEGFVTSVTTYKNAGFGAVVMVNSNEGNPLLDEIMRSIATEYHWPGFLPKPRGISAVTPEEIKSFPGIYSDGYGNEMKITSSEGEFYLNYQAQNPIRLTKAVNGSYYHPGMNFSIRFSRGELKFTQLGSMVILIKK